MLQSQHIFIYTHIYIHILYIIYYYVCIYIFFYVYGTALVQEVEQKGSCCLKYPAVLEYGTELFSQSGGLSLCRG